jgi:hypothetical protein
LIEKPPDTRASAKSEDLERITNSLIEILRQSGYVHSESTGSKIRAASVWRANPAEVGDSLKGERRLEGFRPNQSGARLSTYRKKLFVIFVFAITPAVTIAVLVHQRTLSNKYAVDVDVV